MSEQLVRAKCPGCGRTLSIPSTMLKAALKCKHCGQVLRAKSAGQTVAKPTPPPAAKETPPPAAKAPPAPLAKLAKSTPTPPAEGNEYLERLRERRRKRLKRNLIVAGVVVFGLGIAGLIYRESLQAEIDAFVARARGGNHQPALAETAAPGSLASAPAKPAESNPDATPVPAGPKPVEATARPPRPAPVIKEPMPGRALLIGIRNYLYLNPLNPGYRPENSLTRDPLGLQHLTKAFVKGMRFAENQVAELSDVAEKPIPPTKATLEVNIKQFLGSCRPQDRAVLVFVGQAAEIDGKGYLVPLEGEPTKPETLISTEWLYDELEKCQAHRRLVILDVAHLDPEQGQTRAASGKLSEKLFDSLSMMPKGVEVWMSCSPGEYSYEYNSTYVGSLFIHYLHTVVGELSDAKKRKPIEARAGFKDETLPLVFLAPEVAKEVAAEAKRRAGAQQTPKLAGEKAGDAPVGLENEPPPPSVAITLPEGAEQLADPKLVDDIMRDLNLNDMRAQSLPPFFARNLADYQTDKDVEFVRSNPDQFKFRIAVLEGANLLRELDQSFTMGYKHANNDAQFKKMLEKEQQKPAIMDEKIETVLAKMNKAAEERDKETSKRWQAHFSYVRSRLLAKRIWVQEYNFVLGNKLKKDAPALKNASVNNGWLIVPQEKLQQKDTRQWEKERQELIDKLIASNPGTPWEILARRDKSTNLGLTLQEAKVD